MWLHLFTEQEKILHRKGFRSHWFQKDLAVVLGSKRAAEGVELVGTGQEEGLSKSERDRKRVRVSWSARDRKRA